MINWVRVFNRLFEIIDQPEPLYFGGPRFIKAVQEIDPYFPDYRQFYEERKHSRKSTSRRDYFYDILLGFNEGDRIRIVNAILDQVKSHAPDLVSGVRSEIGGISPVPIATIDSDIWNSARLTNYLESIDADIGAGNYERAVGLAYTCLEGFLRAFIVKNIPDQVNETEIIRLTRIVREHLRENQRGYPDEALTMLSHIAHTVNKARDNFSDSHFGEEAARWLAVFVRDLINSEVRLLLHFL